MVIVGVPLLRTREDFVEFRQVIVGEMIPQAMPDFRGRLLGFPLERITLELSPRRSTLAREYPDISGLGTDLGRLADIANAVIQSTKSEDRGRLQSYGYNMRVVFALDDSGSGAEFLANSLLNRRAIREDGRALVGGMASATLSDGATQWTFRAEPWPATEVESRQVSLSVNRHTMSPDGLPDREGIVQAFLGVWEEANSFMGNLSEHGAK